MSNPDAVGSQWEFSDEKVQIKSWNSMSPTVDGSAIRLYNQLSWVVNPIIYRVSYIPGGAGFLHQQYHSVKLSFTHLLMHSWMFARFFLLRHSNNRGRSSQSFELYNSSIQIHFAVQSIHSFLDIFRYNPIIPTSDMLLFFRINAVGWAGFPLLLSAACPYSDRPASGSKKPEGFKFSDSFPLDDSKILPGNLGVSPNIH